MSQAEAEFVIYIVNEIANIRNKYPSQVYRALEKTGCIQKYLVPFYDVLHTVSSQRVVEDVIEFVKAGGENI